jgi:hypothetical protein
MISLWPASNRRDVPVIVVEVATILLLIVLLVQHELLRAAGGSRAELRMRTLKVFIVPLALVFAAIIAQRIVGFLR